MSEAIAETDALITFKNVSKRYPAYPDPHQALKQINLSIPMGSVTFLTGHSGAGKSTFFRLLSLLEKPTEGEIFIGNTSITRLALRYLPSYRQQIGVVFQDPMLLNDRNVANNIALGLQLTTSNKQNIISRTESALSLVKMSEYAHYKPMSLSTGQRQRIGLARAIAHSPEIILADEPTGNLDPELSNEIIELLMGINTHRGTTILIATHETQLVNKFSQSKNIREIKLQQGRLIS